jgi:hypothetical protein
MKSDDIDRIIERYAEERKHETRRVAQEHFLAYAYLVCGVGEVEQFLKHTRSMLVYYINSLSLFDNPFKNTQVCWLLFMFGWFWFCLYMIADENRCLLGVINCTGTVIFGRSLWKIVWTRWLETSLRIAYYEEVIDLIDSHLSPSNSPATAEPIRGHAYNTSPACPG